MTEHGRLGIRIALVAVIAVLVQVAAVSQLTVFGVNADLTPLVIASVALLSGSITGAIVGFGMGLFLDLALVQTLGVSALIYTLVGYGSGRVRELRAPQATFTPLAIGAAASAVATIGYSLIEFLLGVNAPVSFLLVRDTVETIMLNSLLAMPVYALVRRALGSSLPDDRPRRRRRTYATGGLSPLSRA